MIENIIEILRRGILEIRSLSSNSGEDNRERIHVLADILHNLPKAIENPEALNQPLLAKRLVEYEECYGKSGLSLSDLAG